MEEKSPMKHYDVVYTNGSGETVKADRMDYTKEGIEFSNAYRIYAGGQQIGYDFACFIPYSALRSVRLAPEEG
jgi:hypothetical protein